MGCKPSPMFEINLTSIPNVVIKILIIGFLLISDLDSKINTLQWEKIRGNINSVASRTFFDSEDSKLGDQSQISMLSLSHDTKQIGYCSIDGRGCVLELNNKFQPSYRMVFQFHKTEEVVTNRQNTEKINKCFMTNTVQFNSRSYDGLCTGGSDGQLIYWDLKKKIKLMNVVLMYQQFLFNYLLMEI